jgi:hypothetical protein
MKRCLVLLATLPVLLAADGDIPELRLPIGCRIGQSCAIQHYVDVDPGPGVRDYHCGARTYDKHDGIDFRIRSMIQQRAGVKVLAAADGTVRNVRDGMPDVSVRTAGKASIAGKECGNGVVIRHRRGVETQYCHMAQGSVMVKPGQSVKAGQPLGNVGMSGDAEFPHLHFIVREHGRAVDPFAYGASPGRCNSGGHSLWAPSAGLALGYRAGEVLNAGFATGPVTMQAAQERGDDQMPRPSRDAPALVAFVQAIGLEGGDVQRLTMTGPDGSTLADNRVDPLNRDKAQTILFAGRKRPAAGWPTGRYVARYRVLRDGRAVIDRRFAIALN